MISYYCQRFFEPICCQAGQLKGSTLLILQLAKNEYIMAARLLGADL
ncbi:MAG: hypothetical protein H0S84_00255 [Bacteroidales bacterium]|jgi:hypothetical protein|nr:hypothetical protein [Bacteroidales bacterium]